MPDINEPQIMYYSPLKIIGILVMLGLTGGLFFWVGRLFTYLLAIIMWIAFLSWLIKLFNRKPQVVVSRDGLLDHRTKYNLIPWGDIDSILISRSNRISFHLTNPEKYLKQRNAFQRLSSKIDNKLLGWGTFTISYTGLTGNASDIASYIVYLKSIGIIKESDQDLIGEI